VHPTVLTALTNRLECSDARRSRIFVSLSLKIVDIIERGPSWWAWNEQGRLWNMALLSSLSSYYSHLFVTYCWMLMLLSITDTGGFLAEPTVLRASFSFLTDRLSNPLTNWLRQVAFPVSLTIS